MLNTEEGQKVLWWTKMALIVLAAFLAVQTLDAFKSLGDTDPAYNSISVTGEGEAIAIPDVASFFYSVSTDAPMVAAAQNGVTEKMNAILDELQTLGIEERDIKTTDYSVYPRYTYVPVVCTSTYCPPARQVPDGYTASHTVSVKVRDTERAGEALELVGREGATNVSGLSFTTDDPDKVTEEARAKAIADARAKAKMLSKKLGVRLVRVVSYYDNTNGGPIPYYGEGFGGAAVRATGAPTVPVGENKVKVSVTVTYEIR